MANDQSTIQAITLVQAAYRRSNVDQIPTSFSTAQEFPYNIALDCVNKVIQEMNIKGHMWFVESSQVLVYAAQTGSYNLAALGIDHEAIIRVRREAVQEGELTAMNYRRFQMYYRTNVTIPTQMPSRYAMYGPTLYLDTYPDQDYTLTVYHYANMPLIVNTTDTFVIPDIYLDTVEEGVMAYLMKEMGNPKAAMQYEFYMKKVQTLLGWVKKSMGLATQMPSNF